MNQLTIEHLAPYLPHKLAMTRNGFVGELQTLKTDGDFQISCSGWWENIADKNFYKPILRPLSDLTKEINHRGEVFAPVDRLNSIITLGDTEIHLLEDLAWDWYLLPAWIINKLHEWHFDTQNLIGQDLAISVHDLTENPYEK